MEYDDRRYKHNQESSDFLQRRYPPEDLIGKTVEITYRGKVVAVSRYYIHLRLETVKPTYRALPWTRKLKIEEVKNAER